SSRIAIILSLLNSFPYSDALYLVLHSFPPRRSSDLVLPQPGAGLLPRQLDDAGLTRHTQAAFDQGDGVRQGRVVLGTLRESGDRSEEHTSELQSRENLVCRLLLEKKKK